MRLAGEEIERGHVARDFGNPVGVVLRTAGDNGMRVLIAAIEREPVLRRKFEIESDAAAFDLAEILAREENGRRSGVGGDGDDGAIDLGEEVAGADRAPVPLAREAGFPSSGALAEQVVVGQRELVAYLGGAVELAGRRSAKGAEAGSGDGPMLQKFARDAHARIEDALISLGGLGRRRYPCFHCSRARKPS